MIEIYNEDVTSCVGDLTGLAYACVITDPPYSDVVHRKAVSSGTGGTGGAGVIKRDLGFAPLTPELRVAIATLVTGASRWSAIFSEIDGSHLWRDAIASDAHVRTIPWVRWSQPQLSGDRPPSGCELVSIFHPPTRKHWSGPGSLTALDTRSLRGRDKHPTEKPLDIMLALVSWFSDHGELVLDPCCGSGTTGLACRLLERSAILLDVDQGFASIASERVAAPLSPRDRERCLRWCEYQDAWLSGGAPETKAGEARYARALADTVRIREALS